MSSGQTVGAGAEEGEEAEVPEDSELLADFVVDALTKCEEVKTRSLRTEGCGTRQPP